MSTLRRPPLDLQPACAWLTTHGWDVEQSDPLLARRQDLPGAWALHIDKGGRIRLQRQFHPAAPKVMRRQRQQRLYYLHGERTETIDITTTFQHPHQLAGILSQMIGWALDPPFDEKERDEDV
ncbi:MAG: hypothetical protein GXP37_02775 [Chloroflexi bacterium]|nr:hypothetical protein [Chloroflexota bacterium]